MAQKPSAWSFLDKTMGAYLGVDSILVLSIFPLFCFLFFHLYVSLKFDPGSWPIFLYYMYYFFYLQSLTS